MLHIQNGRNLLAPPVYSELGKLYLTEHFPVHQYRSENQAKVRNNPRILSWTRLSVSFTCGTSLCRTPSGRLTAVQIGCPANLSGLVAPTRKPRIVMYRTYCMLVLQKQKPVILRKAFAVKQMSLKNVQSNK